ncbi:expressed unknown protein [Seminavis robusta]|uniref:Uncharacterized protein n=1 Tax=Seminavis robusta TaxID=568900 RepID=A0A9N8H6V0_9STRA|nr:expressed unknown protein [Seminavis robusta]|eukprot:Sro53_g031530.1 n/a (334) ;mRNA; f:114420-115421
MNSYYVWPPTEDSAWEEIEDLDDLTQLLYLDNWTVRSTEKTFQCDNHTFFIECYGPRYANASLPISSFSFETEKCSSDMYGGDGSNNWIWSAAFMGILPVSVICFTQFVLNRGHYNLLLGLVQFREVEGEARPIKFGVAFTLFCNFSKSGVAIMNTELCGRFAQGYKVDTSLGEAMGVIKFLADFVMLACMFVSVNVPIMLLFVWCIMSCCSSARESTECMAGWCAMCKCPAVVGFRIMLFFSVIASLVVRIFSWSNIAINFDLEYPQWFAVSTISSIDLVLSGAMDLYLIIEKWCWRKTIAVRKHGGSQDGQSEDYDKQGIADVSDGEVFHA